MDMLTADTPTDTYVFNRSESSQFETLPSDTEIFRRVQGIRSRWSVSERLRRRREADRRFSDLLDALSVDHAA